MAELVDQVSKNSSTSGTDQQQKEEESLEDLVKLLFKQMRENPPEWTIEGNQSEELKALARILNGDEGARVINSENGSNNRLRY